MSQQRTTWKKYTVTRVNKRAQTFLHIDAIFQVVECFESEELSTNLGKVELK